MAQPRQQPQPSIPHTHTYTHSHPQGNVPHQHQQPGQRQGMMGGRQRQRAQQGQGEEGFLLVEGYPVAPGVVEEDVWWASGPFTGMGPRSYQRSDERIEEDANHRLTQHGNLDASDISVSVQNGVATLTGTVPSREQNRMAEKTVDTVPGIKDVNNQLQITGPQGQAPGPRQTIH